MAVLQLGAVAMPLSMLFGPEALEYRLQDSEAVVAHRATSARSPTLLAARARAARRCARGRPSARAAGARRRSTGPTLLARAARRRSTPCDTRADDAAVLIYTSGTTGPPKGALIPHRALIGNLTGFVCSQNWFGFDPAMRRAAEHACSGRPADWAWTGGLMDALLPTLYFGRADRRATTAASRPRRPSS